VWHNQAVLRIENVSKRFGEFVAVESLSLQIPAGSVHAFLGPNGAGKTTTIRMCTGLLRPDSGRISINGHDLVTDGVRARSQLAYVPDEPYLYDRLTAREFLDFTARVYGLDREVYRRRLEEVVDRFSLGDFLDQTADGYSHGMRQRVVLAAALLHAPRLLIVDEPLVGLDPKHIRVVLDMLKDTAAAGGAVLMSTHTLGTVDNVADAVSVMNRGRIIASGTVGEIRGDKDLETAFITLTGTYRVRK
jgi:ABC-2 type transport system ATP-binding protein